jgi:copper(I)-binding protein
MIRNAPWRPAPGTGICARVVRVARARVAPIARIAPAAALASLALLCGLVPVAGHGAAPLATVRDAWVRGTVEGQTGSGAYLVITSREDATLVGAASPVADHVEIHEMREVGSVMTMRKIERLPLPAGQAVALDHDYHIMLIGLHRQLEVGQSVPLTLELLDAHGARHPIELSAPVRALSTPLHGPAAHPHAPPPAQP